MCNITIENVILTHISANERKKYIPTAVFYIRKSQKSQLI